MTYPFDQIPAVLTEIADRGGQTTEGRTVSLFGSYFSNFSGRRFDEVVMTTDPMQFEPRDVIAINMLNVRLPSHGIDKLLFDPDFITECSALLQDIPVEAQLWEVSREDVGPKGPGAALWRLVQANVKGTKNGFTVISKLMAAKRPRLFPVWDTLVDGLVQRPNGKLWEPMHDLLSDTATRTELQRLTDGAPPHVTLLRRIDVALWLEADRRRSGQPTGTEHQD